MRIYFNLAFLLFFYAANLFAQEATKIKFGKVTEEDLKMNVYAPDTSASAVILSDEGNSAVTYDVTQNRFMLNFERFLRVKILKQSGTEWGNYNVSLYSFNQTKEEIRSVDGITYNLENGKIEKTNLKKDGIFKERENKYWETTKISLPAVKVGSVIDLKYSIYSPLLWNLQTWKFQYTIPVKWSHLYVKYPEYFNYNQSSLGYHPLNSRNQGTKTEDINYTVTYEGSGRELVGSGHEKINKTITYIANTYDYTAKEVPAMKEEPFCTTLENFTTKVKFELASTDFIKIGGTFKNYTTNWKTICNELLDDEDFGGQINGGNFIESVVEGLVAGKSTETEKAIAIYSHIQKTIKWDEYKSYTTSHPLKKTYSDKSGNSADLNLLLLVMLKKAGISAYPVILSTREHGMLNPLHASLSDCNYVIVKAMLDNKPIYMDVTDPKIPAGQLPLRCMNGNGVVVIKDFPEETPPTVTNSTSTTSVMIELKDGKIQGSVVSRLSGREAYIFRNEIKEAGGSKEQFDNLKNKSKEIEYLDFIYNNVDSLYQPVEKRYNFVLNDGSAEDNSIIYLNPILFGKWLQNPFTSPTRVYPVDFGIPFIENYKMNFTIPAGYKVEELPKSKTILLGEKDGRFTYSIGQMDNRIVVNVRFAIDKVLFVPGEYQNLKEFFDRVVANEAEQIVLKKI